MKNKIFFAIACLVFLLILIPFLIPSYLNNCRRYISLEPIITQKQAMNIEYSDKLEKTIKTRAEYLTANDAATRVSSFKTGSGKLLAISVILPYSKIGFKSIDYITSTTIKKGGTIDCKFNTAWDYITFARFSIPLYISSISVNYIIKRNNTTPKGKNRIEFSIIY